MSKPGALLLLLSAACNQSLFDQNVSGKDAGAGGDGGGSDAAPLCPAPCLGDAVGDFSPTVQGGTNDHWRYRSDGRDALGIDYADMVAGDLPVLPGWVSAGTPPAGIASCKGAQVAACKGLDDHLLVVPTTNAAGLRDPVLSYTVSENGVYHLTGQFRIADGGTAGVDQKLLVSRNARHDLLFADVFSPSLTPGSFDLEVEAAAGDQLMVMLAPDAAGTASPLGLRFYASQATAPLPAKCAYAATFDGADQAAQLKDRCNGMTWEEAGTKSVPSVSPELGTARELEFGDFLKGTGGVIDRHADFTMQFWFKNLPADRVIQESIFHDIECSAQGGTWLTLYEPDNKWEIAWYYHDNQRDFCSEGFPLLLSWNQPDDGEWHFYRIVRSTADEKMRICVDGEEVAQVAMPGSQDLTGADPIKLGRGDPATGDTSGVIDDFRAFRRALPCSTP